MFWISEWLFFPPHQTVKVQAAQSYVKSKSIEILFGPLEEYIFHVSFLHKIQTLIKLVSNCLFPVWYKKTYLSDSITNHCNQIHKSAGTSNLWMAYISGALLTEELPWATTKSLNCCVTFKPMGVFPLFLNVIKQWIE